MNASEFQMVQALLEQQGQFIGQRFDSVDAKAEEIKERLVQVEQQVRITNGTVKDHTRQFVELATPEKLPLMTKAQGRFVQWLAVKVGVLGSAAWWAAQWVLTNWGHLLPLMGGGQ